MLKPWLYENKYTKIRNFELRWLRILVRKGSHHMLPWNQQFLLSAKMNGTQRRTPASLWRMHYAYCSMLKGTTWAEATVCQTVKKLSQYPKPFSVVLVWRHSQLVSQQKIPLNRFFLNFRSNFLKSISGQLFRLVPKYCPIDIW